MNDETLAVPEQEDKEPAPERSLAGRIFSYACTAILILAAGILAYVMICTSSGRLASFFGNSLIKVVTGSMEPSIHVGEYLIIRSVSPDDLNEGDMIAFYSDDPEIKDRLVIHRVIKRNDDGTFVVKGDANMIADEYPVRPERVAGIYIRKAAFFNWLGSFADVRKLLLILVVIPIFLISLFEMKTVTKLMKEVEAERRKKKAEAAKDPAELEKEIERIKKEAIEEYIRSRDKNGSEEKEEEN